MASQQRLDTHILTRLVACNLTLALEQASPWSRDVSFYVLSVDRQLLTKLIRNAGLLPVIAWQRHPMV